MGDYRHDVLPQLELGGEFPSIRAASLLVCTFGTNLIADACNFPAGSAFDDQFRFIGRDLLLSR